MAKIKTHVKRDIMNYKMVIYSLNPRNFFQIAGCNEWFLGELVLRLTKKFHNDVTVYLMIGLSNNTSTAYNRKSR